jgi:hypothetical protein
VYRQFKTLEELVDEAKAVIDAQRFEDPGQGRLFIEPQPPRARPRGANGAEGAAPNGNPPAAPARRRGRRAVATQQKAPADTGA